MSPEVFTLTGNVVTQTWHDDGRVVLTIQPERNDARLDELLAEHARRIGRPLPIGDRASFADDLLHWQWATTWPRSPAWLA